MDLEQAVELPWWWVYIFSLLKRFDNIREYGSMAQDGLPPPKDIWLDDEQLKAWRDNQERIRKEGQAPQEN